jgi:hypothetical protein
MTKPKPSAVSSPSRNLNVVAEPGKSPEALMAGVFTSASLPAALVITDFAKVTLGAASLSDVLDSLKDHASKIKAGDLARVEAMLGGQAAALNTMFAELARRGAVNMGEYIGAAETYLKLALRAQSQCRATLETLAAIKNPPTVFAKQANIAHGPQQVNNHAASIAHAEQIENQPSELMGHDHGERLDTRTAATAGGSDQAMETVGAIHRPAHGRGQGRRQS